MPKQLMARSTAIPRRPISKRDVQAAPGPRILFFSGGTALRETSRVLAGHTPHSIHLVTPFDSGGSSAVLRRYFRMPAVGDMRSRLMALADCSRPEISAICGMLSHRLPKEGDPEILHAELAALTRGEHPLLAAVTGPANARLRHLLGVFREAGPDFDPRGASLGNLVLTAAYLENGRRMDPATALYAGLVAARGDVRLMLEDDLHLLGVLKNGQRILGQHLLTGKEVPPLTSPLRELHLVRPDEPARPVRPPAGEDILERIRSAHLICYPMGSFYSSLVANLLPSGVGRAISRTAAPKVFVPNTLPDSESIGLSLKGQTEVLLRHLRADAPQAIAPDDVLDYVLIDPNAAYPGCASPERELNSLGVRVVVTPLTSAAGAVDPHLLCRALLELAHSPAERTAPGSVPA